MDGKIKLAMGSIGVGLAVLGVKYLAYAATGSIALYSDALESLINVATAVVALFAVRLSMQPADQNHPYGHHKVEYFSAGIAGALIILAAVLILREAWAGIQDPTPIDAPAEGLALSFVASGINAFWAWTLIRRGRALRSPALSADGRHILADVVTSVGVGIGIVLSVATGWAILDPALAALVAVNILWSGWQVLRDSTSGLMDVAVDDAQLSAIRQVISAHAEGAIEAHDLRTRLSGPATFIDFHLVVPAGMAVAEAHDICDRIEAALKAAIEGALVTIHVEPEHKAKHSGVLVL